MPKHGLKFAMVRVLPALHHKLLTMIDFMLVWPYFPRVICPR